MSRSQPARLVAMIQEAGRDGISAEVLMQQFRCSNKNLSVIRAKAREAGAVFFTVLRNIPEGGLYFAREEWRDAAQAAWDVQCQQRRLERKKAPRILTPEQRERKAAAQRALRERQNRGEPKNPRGRPPKRTLEEQREVWEKNKREQRAQLHAIGAHMPALARDGRMVSVHQATCDRQRAATVKVQPARPVDYSRAKVTVCPSAPLNRWEPVGPVHSVVDPSECRSWAKAATA
jgi:hypothetical protein